ncbi:Mob1/phocein [Dactylonectria estremocensis]|uniref:Mob1/phocein n=1 Tax=Dactylonectria estremocensis TaxID=1079267 RepID=A0A9P9F2D1_9HYPO|nr:Mob1/phocein [Dactylonectria estremocensis]
MSLAPSSPRLPSPPPPAEIQIGPNSPSGGPAATPQTTHSEQTMLDASSRRRIHPGTKAIDMAAGPPLIPLHELDSAFQLQEHLAALHCYHTASNTQPLTRATALQLAQPPTGIDRTIWLYELCRFLISQCNSLIVGFLFDTPPCSASTCPEMRASEWQFLCAVHEQPKSCCAIDYCCHTLDWAANVVTDQKIFPSRFVVLSDNHSKNVGVKNLVNVFRRLHRIFAHAWFQHRGVFWSVEGQTGLYVFFKTVCDLYDLLPAENYKLPPEAEGLEAPSAEQDMEKPTPTILKPQTQQRGPGGEDDNLHPARTNTRRHIRSSPSTGSAVTTVLEAEEEEAGGVSRRLKEMHISAPSTVEEEPEVVDIPVIVEQSVIAQSSPDNQDPLTPDSEEDETGEESDADQTVIDADTEEEAEPADYKDGVADEPAPPKESDASEGVEEGDKPGDDPATKEKPEGLPETSALGEVEEPTDETDPSQPTTEFDAKKSDEETTVAPSKAEGAEDKK